jgi:hypothetical protein
MLRHECRWYLPISTKLVERREANTVRFSWTRRWKCRNQVTVEAVPTLASISLELQIKGRGEVEVDDEKP